MIFVENTTNIAEGFTEIWILKIWQKVSIMWKDPIISEVRRIREEMLKETGSPETFVKKLQDGREKMVFDL